MSQPLRRTRNDLIATAVITAIAIILLAIAFFTAPIRSSHLEPTAEEYENAGRLAVVPSKVEEAFRLPDTSPGVQPVIAAGMIITYNDGTITATTPAGDTAWTYKRPNELCLLGHAWDKVVAAYRDNAGCGDVVTINALTGEYAGTRSAIAPEVITRVQSNDRVGYVSSHRVELWRSDMVKTVEYGYNEAPQEPDMQPESCTINSALTRTDLLATTEYCDDGPKLKFQNTTPEDSREPEMYESVDISENAYLVAVSQDAAAIYDPDSHKVRTYDKDGNDLAASEIPPLDGPQKIDQIVDVLPVADLPHHMTYHEGDTLLLMEPSRLSVTGVFQGALGTGFPAGERLLYASDTGIAVANWDDNKVEKIIPVDRGGYTGPVYIDSAGTTIVEKRGEEIVVLNTNLS